MPKWKSFDIRQHGRRVLIGLVVLVVANLAVALLFVQPKVREYRTIRDQYEPRRLELRQFKKLVETREAYLAALDGAEQDLATLRKDVLSTKDRRMVRVQLELAELTRQFGVALERVDYRNDVLAGEGLEYYAMIVPLEGGYTNLRKFIEAVEESEEFLVIESVALDQAKDGGSLLQLNITLATYFEAPEELLLDRDERDRPRRPGPLDDCRRGQIKSRRE